MEAPFNRSTAGKLDTSNLLNHELSRGRGRKRDPDRRGQSLRYNHFSNQANASSCIGGWNE